MKMRLRRLRLLCQRSEEQIEFARINYFYGEMGAGKSTIARLIDYCLGSSQLVMTPALQQEFVSVILELEIERIPVSIERERDSGQAVVTWHGQQAILPVTAELTRPVPGTDAKKLSDLLFNIAGRDVPMVRKSQVNDDSGLERLSIRDLLWYCYLDQESMDSSFFNLDKDADNFRRLKSRNVLRALIGVHQEKVAELEQLLDSLHRKRLRLEGSAAVLRDSLEEEDVASSGEMESRLTELHKAAADAEGQIAQLRTATRERIGHATDALREKARHLASELEAIDSTVNEISESLAGDRRHLNELLAISTKVRRLASARAVLNGVEFQSCPRCAQVLPPVGPQVCIVCGQDETSNEGEDVGEQAKADLASRSAELGELIESQESQMVALRRRRRTLAERKSTIDAELTSAMTDYDSAYLSSSLAVEREKTRIAEEIKYLEKIRSFRVRVDALLSEADNIASEESRTRRRLKEARAAAEQDLSNLFELRKLFLDCLVRSKIPGFELSDEVRMNPPSFLPEVIGESGDLATTSFSNLGSGGKKNLFKCCFALALHRLAEPMDTLLPTLLIIDSPMKNISERENRVQFEGFHRLVYEVFADELPETQLILIDKEYCPPPQGLKVEVKARHMRVDSKTEPPLISYYR